MRLDRGPVAVLYEPGSRKRASAGRQGLLLRGLLVVAILTGIAASDAAAAERPNVLFIAMDDLNSWIGCLGGHPQTITPNLDRLAKSGMLFTNAHCVAPACNPSRTAIFTGRSPHVSGLYDNSQKMREILPDAEIIPKTFMRHGYRASGSGKMLHYFIDAASWDEYFPPARTENPFPRTLEPPQRPVSLPVGGPWQYRETDWGPLAGTDEECGGDFLVTEWIGRQLKQPQEKPFFLACGIYRPHEPWFVPAKYFEPFPLESIQLPPGYRTDDLDDLPPEGKRRGPNRYFAHIQKEGQWKKGIQGYLASIHYADAMLGRVLDALEQGPHSNTTMVVLWSDHGWHLGEKEHWQKFTGWRACTRVPLMIRVPAGAPGLPQGTISGVCDRPVSLLSLFPTLLELCGLPAEAQHDGPSLIPLLRSPSAAWPHAAMTYLADGRSYSVSGEEWRLIHYGNGDEELYDIARDPYEWTNVADRPEFAAKRDEMRRFAPTMLAPRKAPSVESLTALTWQPVRGAVPASAPDGDEFEVHFINRSGTLVELSRIDRQGNAQGVASIAAGMQHPQKTRPGEVWLVSAMGGEKLGFFRVGDRTAQAIVPDPDQKPAAPEARMRRRGARSPRRFDRMVGRHDILPAVGHPVGIGSRGTSQMNRRMFLGCGLAIGLSTSLGRQSAPRALTRRRRSWRRPRGVDNLPPRRCSCHAGMKCTASPLGRHERLRRCFCWGRFPSRSA